jgi:hypothetical protein
VVDAGLPESFLIGLGDTLLPIAGQAIVATYNLPTLAAANQTLVRYLPPPQRNAAYAAIITQHDPTLVILR